MSTGRLDTKTWTPREKGYQGLIYVEDISLEDCEGALQTRDLGITSSKGMFGFVNQAVCSEVIRT